MLKLCENKSDLDFLPDDPFAARITALFDTYGTIGNFAFFWVQYHNESGAPVCAISKTDGNITICCLDDADIEELTEFLNAVGYRSITVEERWSKKLGFNEYDSSYIAKYNGKERSFDDRLFSEEFNCRNVYELLTGCGFDMGDYGSFAADILNRLNKGTASFAQIRDADHLSCAFALFIGRKSVLLGAVATDEKLRGKGYASQTVGFLANKYRNKKTFIFCRNDSLLPFYEKNGFESVGKWAVILGKDLIY